MGSFLKKEEQNNNLWGVWLVIKATAHHHHHFHIYPICTHIHMQQTSTPVLVCFLWSHSSCFLSTCFKVSSQTGKSVLSTVMQALLTPGLPSGGSWIVGNWGSTTHMVITWSLIYISSGSWSPGIEMTFLDKWRKAHIGNNRELSTQNVLYHND